MRFAPLYAAFLSKSSLIPLAAFLLFSLSSPSACKRKDSDKTDSIHIIDARLGTCLHSKLASAIIPEAGFAKGKCPKFIQVGGKNASMTMMCNSYKVKEDNAESFHTWTIYNKRLAGDADKAVTDVTADAAEKQCVQLIGSLKK